jgi:probable HAF family extracellular repeat protein
VKGTYPQGIDPQGDIIGGYTDRAGIDHGFLLYQGRYSTIDGPNGADGTMPMGINPQGDIVGSYTDGTGTSHGFLWRPDS